MKRLDIERGQRFGMLTVMSEVGKHGTYRMFRLKCDCGATVIHRLNHLRRSTHPVQSCGCLQTQGNHRTHGFSGTPTYKTWTGMKSRCSNPSHKSFRDYGGRGIKVCKRWQLFENFLTDMGQRPSENHEIDRIDNEENYKPGNCHWVLRRDHARNRRLDCDKKTSQHRGVDYWNNQKWRARIMVNGQMIHIGMFDREIDAAKAYDAIAKYYLSNPSEKEST